MAVLLALAILAAGPSATDERYPSAVEVFYCDFGDAWDANYDGWPEGWIRKRGPNFPVYAKAGLSSLTDPQNRSLDFHVDGGGIAATGPQAIVSQLFSYVLDARVKTQNLVNDRAYVSITFYDRQRTPLETFKSRLVQGTSDWTTLRIGPVESKNPDVSFATVGLHLEPTDDEDLQGTASFDDVWLGRTARMSVTTGNPTNVYLQGSPARITCNVSGVQQRELDVSYELLDVTHNTIASETKPLEGTWTDLPPQGVQPSVGRVNLPSSDSATAEQAKAFVGSTTWLVPVPDVGFYWVRITMRSEDSVTQQREVPLTIISRDAPPPSGEFGWAFPTGHGPLTLAQLSALVTQAGVHSVKYPLWLGTAELDRLDQLSWFAERLTLQGVEMVGLLSSPPKEVTDQFSGDEAVTTARIFGAEPSIWYPSLEPIVTQMSMNVHSWQLGTDRDNSFADYPNATRHVATVKAQLEQFGQKVDLGIGWNWQDAMTTAKNQPWTFVALSNNPPLTPDETRSYLQALRDQPTQRWVVVEPLPRGEFETTDRAADVVFRMMAAKAGGAERIYLPDPMDPEKGVLNAEGVATEMFLPWRNTAVALAGATSLGSIKLSGGSPNQIFRRGDEAVMVVWNNRPATEVVQLGAQMKQTDVWGREIRRQKPDEIQVSPLPSFVSGLDERLVRWHMQCGLTVDAVPSVFGTPHANAVVIHNTFGAGVSGRVRVATPDVWRTTPREMRFTLSPGQRLEMPFTVILPYDANSGLQNIRLEFEISAEQRFQFSVDRPLRIGLGDINVEVTTQLNDRDELEVTQQLFNRTEGPLGFRFQLLVPGRRRIVAQVVAQSHGVDTQVYRIERGSELIGQTLWLKGEELDGPRALNYRFKAE